MIPSPVGPIQFESDLHLVGMTSTTPTKVTFMKPEIMFCKFSIKTQLYEIFLTFVYVFQFFRIIYFAKY